MIDITYFANKTNGTHASSGFPMGAMNGHAWVDNRLCNDNQIQTNPDDGGLILTFRGIVYPWHLDHMNHMNVQHYVGMFDQSSWILLATLGLDSQYFRDNRCGVAALEQTIRYQSELRCGDMFEIRSAVFEIREKTLRLLHNMYNARTGAMAASTTILGVHMNTDARKSSPWPDEVRNRAQATVRSRKTVAQGC
jgi:acyl-CoA thioester hydrolase